MVIEEAEEERSIAIGQRARFGAVSERGIHARSG